MKRDSAKREATVGSDSKPIHHNLFQLASFVLSLPYAMLSPERIFSLMTLTGRGDGNRMSVSLVSAELQVFTNYGLHYRDF